MINITAQPLCLRTSCSDRTTQVKCNSEFTEEPPDERRRWALMGFGWTRLRFGLKGGIPSATLGILIHTKVWDLNREEGP